MTQFAIINEGTITGLGEHSTDEQAQAWFAGTDQRGSLVSLDLGADETPRVGDSVEVDSDGVATLVAGADAGPLRGILR